MIGFFFLISAIIIDDPNFTLVSDKHYRVQKTCITIDDSRIQAEKILSPMS